MKRWWTAALAAVVTAIVPLAPTVGFAQPRSAPKITLRGVDSQNVHPFTLRYNANVLWTCRGCQEGNFIFETHQVFGVVNALNHTHGLSYLPRGHYSGVSITGTGSWTIVLSPAPARPVRSSYVLTGVDGTNLRPFTLTHGSTVIWSCPGCLQSNFIFDTRESIGVVNALNHTHGTSYLDRGHYTGVTVTASGPWKITIK